jgi:CYTH domain-containing protein
MGTEIERRFLVDSDAWRQLRCEYRHWIQQGYLSLDPQRVVRVRLVRGDMGTSGFLTVKGRGTIRRPEYEYPIPAGDAEEMLLLCHTPYIEKDRHYVRVHRRSWSVDVFEGANEGLILAEVEIGAETEDLVLPPWVGAEVTHDPRYSSINLVRNPFSRWPSPPSAAGPHS